MSKIIDKLEKDRADAVKMSEKLFETVESAIYQLDKLEDLLDMPKRGCTRNHFNALMRTLKEGITDGDGLIKIQIIDPTPLNQWDEDAKWKEINEIIGGKQND